MIVTYLDAADSELTEAINYYNDQVAGLGFEFADEVKEALEPSRIFLWLGRPYRNAYDAAKSIGFLTASSTRSEKIF